MIKVRRLPDGPETGSWKKGANVNNIPEHKWYRESDYRKVGEIINQHSANILAYHSYRDSIKAVKQVIIDLPKHIQKPIIIKLNEVKTKKEITELVYRMILRYTP